MEKLYEFNISSYHTQLYKDYCEVSEEELLGEHHSDEPPIIASFNKVSTLRKEFDYDKTLFDEESYVKNYNNLCSLLQFKRITLCVVKNEDKISIKFFLYHKNRQAGKKYFKKETICHFITYNFKQNCLYTGYIKNYHLKRKAKKQLGKNLWCNKPIQSFIQLWVNHIRGMRLNNFDKIEQSGKEVNEAIGLFLLNIPNINPENHDYSYDNIIYKRYLDGIGVKTPNNWMYFNRRFPQITKKIFKKHKFKFVDAFMGMNGLYGDKVKRVLHNVTSTDGIESFKFAIQFFGQDFILSQPDQFIIELIESTTFFMDWENYLNQQRLHIDDFTKTEVKYCFEIFKLVIRGEINFHSFTDHLVYKTKLKNFEPVMWRAKDYDSFNEEHYIWSEKVGSLSSAEYRRIYDEKFKEYVETPIDDYYPVLLNETREYNMESFNQSNCVRSYTDKPASIIISLRKGGSHSKTRATIEYKIEIDFDKIKLNRVQSLGRYNEKLDESWNEVLNELDKRMNYTIENDIFMLPEVEIKYGGKTFMSHLTFVEDNVKAQLYNGTTSKLPPRKIVTFTNNPVKNIYHPTLNIL